MTIIKPNIVLILADDMGYSDIEDVVVQSANTVGGADQNLIVHEKWPWQFRSPEENKSELQKLRD